MSDITVIVNARLPQRPGRYQIVIEAHRIKAIEPLDPTSPSRPPAFQNACQSGDRSIDGLIDVQGDWLSLGAVDLQINGALGLAFPNLRSHHFEQLQAICDLLWQQGVAGFCPTLVTTSEANFKAALAGLRDFSRQQPKSGTAQILGAHLEGPFLNPLKRGAHPEECLQPLSLASVQALVGDFAESVSILTLAPELLLAEEQAFAAVMSWLCDRGITVSLGHSLATADEARCAFDLGATMVTHAFNAMPGLHHREPGLLGAALTDQRVSCGFIADGQHICPTMLDLLLRVDRGSAGAMAFAKRLQEKPAEGIVDLPYSPPTPSLPDPCRPDGGLFLVSDALSPLGLPDGLYPWDSRQIEVTQGTARLADGTLSGTTLPLIAGVQNLVNWGLCSPEEAIALVTTTPRQAIGAAPLAVDSPAELLRWRQDESGKLSWEWLELEES